MTKTNAAYEPSRLAYVKPSDQPTAKPHDEEPRQEQEPQTGSYRPKPTLPKDEPDLPRVARPPLTTLTNDRPLSEYLTRRQAAEYVNNALGRPMSFSTASKLAALREFAEPAVLWGRRPLYTRDDLRTWAEARSRPTKERAANQTPNCITEHRKEGAG
jgi:hypothetical protein